MKKLCFGKPFMALVVLAVALTFALAFASCDNGMTGNNRVQGTYSFAGGIVVINFTGSNFSLQVGGEPYDKGTFTVSGVTIICTITVLSEDSGNKVGTIYTFTIIDKETLRHNESGAYYYKIK